MQRQESAGREKMAWFGTKEFSDTIEHLAVEHAQVWVVVFSNHRGKERSVITTVNFTPWRGEKERKWMRGTNWWNV